MQPPQNASAAMESGVSEAAVAERMESMGFRPPPLKTAQTVAASKDDALRELPPAVRYLMTRVSAMAGQIMIPSKAMPGFHSCYSFDGSSYPFSCGYRDASRSTAMEDKGNHLRAKDPLNYAQLTVPFVSLLFLQMHDKKLFGLETPIKEFLPNLPEGYEKLNAREIFARRVAVDDAGIYRACGARIPNSLFTKDLCVAYQKDVYAPIRKFFQEDKGVPGMVARENVANFLATAGQSVAKPMVTSARNLARAPISHFSIALLIAALEKETSQSFEDLMHRHVFVPLQAHSAGFGPPQPYRDPSDMFYVPRGLALQHNTFHTPIPENAKENCGPRIFDASMNLYVPNENSSGMFQCTMDTIKDAMPKLKNKPDAKSFYELGVLHTPETQVMRLTDSAVFGNTYQPTYASFHFNTKSDLGTFTVTAAGSRRARWVGNSVTMVSYVLFKREILNRGVKLNRKKDEKPSEVEEQLEDAHSKEHEFIRKYIPEFMSKFQKY